MTIADNAQLAIGLDFGAAFTRVVIGDNLARYAVPFGEFAHPDNQYLLPSILGINNNLCCLSSADNATGKTDNLKSPLLEGTYTDHDLVRISAYLALVFRATRDWLSAHYEKRYKHSQLSWSINAGLPVDNASHTELSDTFIQLIYTAWIVSVLPGPVTLNRVSRYMDVDERAFDAFPAVYRLRIIKKKLINTFPVCCAQICAYVHSGQYSDGLHMLIDIGAGTINITTFNACSNISDNGVENSCELYACAVEPIGISYLLGRRYENLKLAERKINLFKDIPDTATFSQTYDLTEKDIMFADTLYSGEAARLINRVLDLTKEQYCPDSICWERGVPTFTCGGGTHLQILQNIMHRLENKPPPHKIKSISLNLPDDLLTDNLPAGSYDRLSVAYGLSFPPERIDATIKKQTDP